MAWSPDGARLAVLRPDAGTDPNAITGVTCAVVDGCMQETMIEVCEEYCEYGKEGV